jgi:pimeloyl-ACP methyl ester carboxylesterase
MMMAQMRAMSRYDATPRLGALSGVPTLVVSAALDRISPPWVGRKIATDIPGARYVEIPNAAHGVPLRQPEVINALLRKHFLKVDGASA